MNIAINCRVIKGCLSAEDKNDEHGKVVLEDEDVAAERSMIEIKDPRWKLLNILEIRGLTKIFENVIGRRKKKKAVDNISFAVRRGECFGLLGLNGAGKSTTFKMLTGQLKPTSGEFTFSREDTRMGYCPQNNAIDPNISVINVLRIYASIIGLSESAKKQVVDEALREMGLQKYRNVRTKALSGGNKRKLCTAIAFLGIPNIILMDEPTSGMDALSKRLVWNQIRHKMSGGNVSVILTSHSMEECEVLCSRLVIMSSGKFRCLGSPTHIKNKFGRGYVVAVLFKDEDRMAAAAKTITTHFSNVENITQRHVTLTFQVTKSTPADIFDYLVSVMSVLGIQDISVKQVTLDEVFVNFVHDKYSERTYSDSSDPNWKVDKPPDVPKNIWIPEEDESTRL